MSAFSNGLEASVVGKYGGEVQYMAINFSQRISFTYSYSIIMLELKKEIECPYNQLFVMQIPIGFNTVICRYCSNSYCNDGWNLVHGSKISTE